MLICEINVKSNNFQSFILPLLSLAEIAALYYFYQQYFQVCNKVEVN